MKTNTRNIKKALNNLSGLLTSACHNINHGGCGKIAGLVGEHLENIGVKCEVVTVGNKVYDSPKVVRHKIKTNQEEKYIHDPDTWENYGLSCSHLALRFKLGRKYYTWDSDGLDEGKEWFGCGSYECNYPFGHGLTVEECKIMSVQKGFWNTEFRTQRMKKLTQIVTNKFAQFDKN